MSTSHFPFNRCLHFVPVFLIFIPVTTVIHVSRDWCKFKQFLFPNNFSIDGVKYIETCLRIKNDDPSILLFWPALTSSFEWKTKQQKKKIAMKSWAVYRRFLIINLIYCSWCMVFRILDGCCWFPCNFFFFGCSRNNCVGSIWKCAAHSSIF